MDEVKDKIEGKNEVPNEDGFGIGERNHDKD